MDQRRRLNFLTMHFSDLQGLRLAPLWILSIFVPQWPGHPILAIVTIFPAMALLYGWFRLCQRLYDSRLGRLKANGYLPPSWTYLVISLYLIGSMTAHRSVQMPKNTLSLICTCLLLPQVFAPINPVVRRCYYAVGACITSALFVSTWAPIYQTTTHSQTVILGLTMMTVTVLDHWLLFNTISGIRQDLYA
jgi:hypothetical protein